MLTGLKCNLGYMEQLQATFSIQMVSCILFSFLQLTPDHDSSSHCQPSLILSYIAPFPQILAVGRERVSQFPLLYGQKNF